MLDPTAKPYVDNPSRLEVDSTAEKILTPPPWTAPGEKEETMKLQPHMISDWRQAVRNPPSYRIGNSTVRLQTKFVYLVAAIGAAVLLYMFIVGGRHGGIRQPPNNGLLSGDDSDHWHLHRHSGLDKVIYNSTYPLSAPITSPKGLTFKICIVSDLDVDSKDKVDSDTWISYLKSGLLTYNPRDNAVTIEWTDKQVTLKSALSSGGRGMELSELIVFNANLYAVDDRTGIVYRLEDKSGASSVGTADRVDAIPWVILSDGDGRQGKGFKSEWAAVKDEQLYIGGLGKEWTSATGELIHLYPQWIKVVTPEGNVQHVDWHTNYEKIKNQLNIKTPGYIIHEAVCWSSFHRKWVFLPRRASKEHYDEHQDEKMGTNLLIMADESFADITVVHIGQVLPTHGFSTFKFVPGTEDQVIVAIKSEENEGKIASYIMAFDIKGNILLPEKKIGDYKFEGIEFV